ARRVGAHPPGSRRSRSARAAPRRAPGSTAPHRPGPAPEMRLASGRRAARTGRGRAWWPTIPQPSAAVSRPGSARAGVRGAEQSAKGQADALAPRSGVARHAVDVVALAGSAHDEERAVAQHEALT